MNKIKHILAIFMVLGVFSIAFFCVQKLSDNGFFNKEVGNTLVKQDNTPTQDTIAFVEKLKKHLEVIQTQKNKKREVWVLGNGRTITHYLLQAQRFLRENGGDVLYMEELYGNYSAFQSASIDALCPNGDTLRLLFNVSDNIFKNNASYLSIAFQVKKLTPELIVALNELKFPYDLMIIPFDMESTFYPDLDRVKRKELVLWLPMESSSLNDKHKKQRPIRIHHTQEQIENIIRDAKTLVPNAKGVATRFGEQAVEHKQLLQATLKPIKEHNMWFIDLSMNKKSIALETCNDLSIPCKSINPYNPSNSALEDYIRIKLRGAARNGMAAIVVPLDEKSLSKLKSIDTLAKAQGTTIVNLSTFMKY